MDWNDLRVFLALYRRGTFAGAGRELAVNATTAARRLDALEQSVATQLFARTADGLVPTAAGEGIIEAAEQIERQTQLIASSVGGEDARLAGNVRLAVTETFAVGFLIDHLGPFRRMHPDIDVELNTSDFNVDLARSGADVAVRFREPGAGPGAAAPGHFEVLSKRATSIGIAVFASRDYLDRAGCPANAEDVDGHDVVVPLDHATHLPGISWAASVKSRTRVALRSDGLEAIAAASAAGLGLCAVPSFLALRHDNLLRVSPPDVIDSRDVWLLMPADLRRVARVRAVWDFLVTLFATWEPSLSGSIVPEGRYAQRV
jgi:DNA-binding transcriptional LysR family regulator